MNRWWTIVSILIALLLARSLGSAHTEPSGAENKKPREHNVLRLAADAPQLAYLRIATIGADAIPALEPLHGRITYDDDVTARVTAPVAGRVVAILAKPGDRVGANQVLAQLDAPDYAQARADMRKADADFNLKNAALTRAKTLYDGGVIARKDFEVAQNDFEQAQAERERADARLRNLGVASDNLFSLRARIDGVVMERHINPGTELQPDTSTPLFIISDPNRLWIEVETPEMNLESIHVGQAFRIESEAYPQRSFAATVVSIAKVLDPVTRRIVVRCSLRDDAELLKPEMFVRATPLGGDRSKPHVPNGALVTEGVNTFLFVEKSAGVFEKRSVTLAYRGREESYIERGLAADERAVISGALLLNAELQGD